MAESEEEEEVAIRAIEVKDMEPEDLEDITEDQPGDGKVDHGPDYFRMLPDEVVVHIFSFLACPQDLCLRCAPVCRKWHRLSQDPALWMFLELAPERRLNLTRAHEIIERCTLLKKLSMRRRTDAELLAIFALERCPRLECLELVYCEKPSYVFLEAVDEFGTCLRHLSLFGTELHPEMLFGSCRARSLRRITHLDLFNCKGLNDVGLESIADECTNLISVNIEEVEHLSDNSVKYFLNRVCHTIRCLLLDGESLTDESFSRLDKCRHLKTLGVNFADEMSSSGLQAISHLTDLQYLKVRRGKRLTGLDFVTAFHNRKLRHLRRLDLSECAGLTDMGLEVIAANCPALINLCLDWCWELTDTSVRCVILRCLQLRYLHLVGVVHLTSDALHDVNLLLPKLEVLNLQQCPDIDDHQLYELASRTPKLELTNYYGERVFGELSD